MARSTDREAAQLVEDIGALAGANAILVKPGNLAAVPYHGVRYRSRNGKDIIAVIEGTERPAAVTALHELGHEMKADFPEDYAKFAEAVRQELDAEKYADWEFARRANAAVPESDPDKLFDEFCNDLAGAQAERQEFWKNVLKKIPDVARRMAEILGRIIRRISRNLRKSSLPPRRKAAVEGVIGDLPRVRAVLEDVVASVAAKTEARRAESTTMPHTVQAARFSERTGKTLLEIERQMPMLKVSREKLDTNLPMGRLLEQARRSFDSWPGEVADKDGDAVRLRHNRQGTVDVLFDHLTTSGDDAKFDRIRTSWVPLVPRTVAQADYKLQDGRRWIYVGKYDNGFRHLVVVDGGSVVSQEPFRGDLVTHFSQRQGTPGRQAHLIAYRLGGNSPLPSSGGAEPRGTENYPRVGRR